MSTIANVRVEDEGATRRLVGTVGPYEVWFRFPAAVPLAARGEPFVALGLFLAMSKGEALRLDASAPVSPTLLAALPTIQAILSQWNPGALRVEVEAVNAAEPERLVDGVLSCFSGGVDSLDTFVRHRGEITHLLTLGSFDLDLTDESFEELVAKAAAFADRFGVALVPGTTNARAVSDAMKVNWQYTHGPVLGSLPSALGFPLTYIPSSYSYRHLKPWGSHPSLDPLWSTATTRVVHDGTELYRTEKIAALAAHPEVLAHLQVCFEHKARNCGRCSKCVRTGLALNLLGVENPPIPYSDAFANLDAFRPKTDLAASFVWDVARLAQERGDARVEKALRGILRRYLFRRGLADAAKALLGDLRHRGRTPTWAKRPFWLADPDKFVLTDPAAIER